MKKLLLLIFPLFFFVPHAHAAIAFDAESSAYNASTNSLSWTLTTVGSDTMITITAFQVSSGNSITSVKVDGNSATFVASAGPAATRYVSAYIYHATSSGSHTIVVSYALVDKVSGFAESVTGAASSGQPDTYNTYAATSGHSASVSLTTGAGDWVIGGTYIAAGTTLSGTGGFTLREERADDGGRHAMLDSNGTVSAGTASYGVTSSNTGTSDNSLLVAVALKPAVTTTPSFGILNFFGWF